MNVCMSLKKIAIINGPNLSALGAREDEHYGKKSLLDLELYLKQQAQQLGDVELSFFQSNHEGAIIDRLYELRKEEIEGVILNPGALAHTSLALHDAIIATGLRVIEVHLSQLFKRSQVDVIRGHFVVAPACQGVIVGLGFEGYALALRSILNN